MADTCINDNYKYMITLLYRSGKSFDQTGLYYECLNSAFASIYYFVLFKNTNATESNRVFMGLCASASCTSQVISQQIDGFLKAASYPLQVYSVTQPSQYQYPMGFAFYFIAIWLSLLTLLVILATLSKRFQKHTNKYLACFALQDNLKIFSARQSSLTFFNGIKGVCLFWIVMGHSFTIRVVDSQNWISMDNQFLKVFNLVPLGAFFAVDIFFYVGGFLLGYVFFTQLKKNSVIIYLLAIVHRLLRFYPSYITAILIWFQIFPHTGSGPFWPLQQRFVDPCKHMWKNILFIDNMWNEIQCMPWAWYLANDVQLFVVCIFVLFIYNIPGKGKLAGRVIILLGILCSVAFNFYSTYIHKYTTVAHIRDIFTFNDYFMNLYIKPWSRCPPYLFGLLIGIQYYNFFIYNKKKQKGEEPENVPIGQRVKLIFEHNRYLRYVITLAGLGIMLFLIFIPRNLQLGSNATWSQMQHSLYLSSSKILFVFGAFLFTLPATLGFKDLVVFFFDTRLFSVIGKISFWAYLIHYMVIMRNSYNLKQVEYFTNIEILHRYATDLSISLGLAFLLTMIVEAPFVKLEKFLMKRGGEGKTEKIKQKQEESVLESTKQSLIVK